MDHTDDPVPNGSAADPGSASGSPILVQSPVSIQSETSPEGTRPSNATPEPLGSQDSSPTHLSPDNIPSTPATPATPSAPSENTVSATSRDTLDVTRPASRASHRLSAMHGRSLDSAAENPGSSSNLSVNQPHRGPPTRATPESDRNRRRRSAMDFRGARISDLFTNFLSRRQETDQSAGPTEDTPPPPSPAPPPASTVPIVNEPKPDPPPPALPPPTLAELGLTMSVLTGNLNPAHFSNPPTSGTLLLPHYLLLCHSQGLDVLPLVGPPAPEPYALIRRISFKSVVVMEERGVLIAIAGRRDGVRVYALDELRRVIQWRLDIETRKEKEKSRKEESKKLSGNVDQVFGVNVIPSGGKLLSKHLSQLSNAHHQPRPPLVARPASAGTGAVTRDAPPAYSAGNHPPAAPQLRRPTPPGQSPRALSIVPPELRARSGSVSAVLAAGSSQHPRGEASKDDEDDDDQKGDWAEVEHWSDEEPLSLAAAGASGSAALDERTSAMSSGGNTGMPGNSPRPALRDLRTSSVAVLSPRTELGAGLGLQFRETEAETAQDVEDEGMPEEDEVGPRRNGEISLAQILLESRIPDLPPPGTRLQQQPILLTSTSAVQVSNSTIIRDSDERPPASNSRSGRRRWSLLGSTPTTPTRSNHQQSQSEMLPAPRSGSTPNPSRSILRRSSSTRSDHRLENSNSSGPSPSNTNTSTLRPPASPNRPAHAQRSAPSHPPISSHRFLPRIFSLGSRRRSEEDMRKVSNNAEREAAKQAAAAVSAPPPPQPKLDYVKLPGTKGSVLIKAVETQRKSFLAILCGENGEKVELFAGTYRTALSLSRTFILPDSPRSIELQVQGDDLVEIYLVFAQNVFGLEPATVRVREVRIGRAERRAARRRAREGRLTGEETPFPVDEEAGPHVERPPESITLGTEDQSRENGDDQEAEDSQAHLPTTTVADTGELLALAAAQSAPYTTFQQLSFAPCFPLATLGDEVIIPPSYPDFLRHKEAHEGDEDEDLAQPQPQSHFTPPGLPPPRLLLQCKWYYRDPKGVVQGPWNTALMQSWYKDGLLPLDLPVRRDMDDDFVSLKDLRSQAVDPEQPFKQLAPASSTEPPPPPPTVMVPKPLLPPVSILEQPRHYGPPALFFSSRGGHSTTVVDAKGRPVLKGRFVWSSEEEEAELSAIYGKLGDVKRVEAFEVKERTVLVALRQCGLEATDVGDALFKPADESRAYIPHYQAPLGFNRRGCFTWRIGGPLGLSQEANPVVSRAHVKKSSTGILRSTMRQESGTHVEEAEISTQEEVIFLGRREDDVYMCERNGANFRILRLSPTLERSTAVVS